MSTPLCVLLLEETQAAKSIIKALMQAGYTLDVRQGRTKADFLAGLYPPPDLIIANPDLPGLEAGRALQILRTKKLEIPLLIVSSTQKILQERRQKEGVAGIIDPDHPASIIHIVRLALENRSIRQSLRETEKALCEERSLAQQYLDIADVILVRLDTEGKITLLNREGSRLLGYFEGQLLGKDWFETCVPPNIRIQVREVFNHIVVGDIEPARSYQNPVLTRSGEERLISWRNTLLYDSEGNISGTLSSGEDITIRSSTEEALRQSEEQYRTLFESTPVGIGVASQAGNLLAFNDAMLIPGGYTRQDLQQISNVAELYYSLQQREEVLDTLQREGAILKHEVQFKRRDGSPYDALLTLLPIRFKGQPCVQALVEDITEQKKAEQALRESEERYRQLVELSPDGIAIHCEGKFVFVNQTVVRLIGARCAEDLIGLPVLNIVHPDYRQIIQERMRQAVTGGAPLPVLEEKFIRFDGSVIDVEVAAMPFTFQGKPAAQVIARDIADRKRAEDAVRTSEALYRTLVETSPDAVIMTDLDGKLMMANRQALEIYGFQQPEEVLGRSIYELITPQDRQRARAIFRRLVRKGDSIQSLEISSLLKDNRIMPSEVSAALIQDAQGQSTGVIGVIRDISQRKQSENAMQALLKGTATVGEAFFRSLVLELASALQVRYAFVGQVVSTKPHAIQTVALCVDREIVDNILYDMDGAPCETVVGKLPCFYPRALQETFPRDTLLVELNAQSYLGVPLFSFTGKSLGLVAVMDDKPMPESNLARNLLSIFAARASAELERLQTEAKYRSIVDSISEGIFQTTPDGSFLMANPALAHILGYETPEALIEAVTNIPEQLYVNPQERQAWQQLLEERTFYNGFEVQLYHEDGSKIWVSINVHAVNDASGKLLCYEGTLIDITERNNANELIKQNAARTQALDAVSQSLVEAGLDYRATLDTIVKQISELTGGLCEINLLSKDGLRMEAAATHHPDPEVLAMALQLRHSIPHRSDEGMPGEVLRTGQPLYVPILTDETRVNVRTEYLTFGDQIGLHSAIAVPMRAQGHTMGVLTVFRDRHKSPFSSQDLSFLVELANRAALAISNARLLEETERRLQYVQALHDIDVAITSSLDLGMTLNFVVEQATTQLKVDAAAILLLNPHMQSLNYMAGRGFRTQAIQRARIRLGISFAGRAAYDRQTVFIPNLHTDPDGHNFLAKFLGEDFAAYAGTPLIAKGQVKGVLEIYHRSQLTQDEEWLNFLETLARQAAIAIDNSSLFQELQRSNAELTLAYDATIEGWSRALDLRDRETEGHTQRVTDMTERLALRLGVSELELVYFRRGALLHDIGKMGVPDRILHKPASLTEDEWEIMRLHPRYAFDLLSPISYLRLALDIPFCHHEKWDGTGYPRKLQGEQIPLAARIFAVVDVWDAITSDRPYRPAWSKEHALEYIRSESGAYFDPKVVEAFLQLMEEEQPDRSQSA